MFVPLVLAVLLASPAPGAAPAAAPPAAAPAADPGATPMPPERVLGQIRTVFRAHRPPPPFVTYTLKRAQKTEQGYPDFLESYTYHIYCRSVDRACLARKVFRDTYRGDPEFQRPAFNEDRDPGPPTADLFEPAPLKSHPIEFVPTPEPSREPLRELGTVRAVGEFDYRVVSMDRGEGLVHLTLEPTRDPMRNRIREIWADEKTYELRRLAVTDRLFDQGPDGTHIYGARFLLQIAMIQNFPVVTDIHGEIGDNYSGDGKIVDYTFRDIEFPATLPDWYFDARQYGRHLAQMPL
jgi:hypothetical protein